MPRGWKDYTKPISIEAVEVETLPVDIKVQTVAVLKIDIAAQTLSQLNVNIAASAVTINVKTAVGEHVDADIVSSVTLPINIVAQTITALKIDIAAQSLSQLNVNIVSSAVTLDVNIVGSAATLNVNIASQTVDVNVKTSTGANIVIDKLTVAAYTEDRRTLSNNGATASMLAPGTTARRGKFFPRGCRGFIDKIEVYCDNLDTADHTLFIYFSPQPGMGRVISVSLMVPAGASAAWRSVTVGRFWNFDSMFIYVLGDSASYPRIGYDTGAPSDYYASTDEITWIAGDARCWFKAVMTGETVGDLPVSGTVNTIEVPVETTGVTSGGIDVGPDAVVTLLTVEGPGKNLHLHCYSDNPNMMFVVECDGVRLRIGVLDCFTTVFLNTLGYTACTPGISLLKYNATEGNLNAFTVTFPFQWKRKLVVKAKNVSVSTRVAVASLNYIKQMT